MLNGLLGSVLSVAVKYEVVYVLVWISSDGDVSVAFEMAL